MREIEYRTENCYGSGVRDLAQILSFEICELGNTAIIDEMIAAGYAAPEMADFDPDDPDRKIGERLAAGLREKTGRDMRYGLWLAARDEVIGHYNDGSPDGIDAYEISDVILSDLGPDGRLYAYERLPEPLDLENANRPRPKPGVF